MTIKIAPCSTCGRWWAYDDTRQCACTIHHPDPGCCHTGQTDVTETVRDAVEHQEMHRPMPQPPLPAR